MAMAIQLQAPVHRIPPPASARLSVLAPSFLRTEDHWLRTIMVEDRHVNVLVHCDDVPVQAAIDEIGDLCGRPLWTTALPGELQLPERGGETLVIGDVSALTLMQQIELHDWLDRFGSTSQIFSFTSSPLWPLLERGRFLEGLFYRLNVVTLTADPLRH